MSTYLETKQNPTVTQTLFEPVWTALNSCINQRVCPVLDDRSWLKMGLTRALHFCSSGRGFLQEYAGRETPAPNLGTFFESYKSQRRLDLVSEIQGQMPRFLAQVMPDRLAQYEQLQEFEVFAGDGHWHGAAAHDPVIKGKKHATGHCYGLNLRTQGMVHLSVVDQETRLKEHDIHVLKRLELESLRQGTAKGRKVLWIWDKAGIDFHFWHRCKQTAGVYFLSLTKKNMKLEVIGELPYDQADPLNQGVVDDQYMSTSNGVMVREVTYQDPVSGEYFRFLTNELNLAPGLIAHLYRLRWEIEKVFDEFKNKFHEKKAWATSPIAKCIQAQVLCLMHDLLLLFEETVLKPAQVFNQTEDHRRQKRLDDTKKKLQAQGTVLPILIESLQKCTQHSLKLIRWIRSFFFSSTCCCHALEALRTLYHQS